MRILEYRFDGEAFGDKEIFSPEMDSNNGKRPNPFKDINQVKRELYPK